MRHTFAGDETEYPAPAVTPRRRQSATGPSLMRMGSVINEDKI